MKKTDLQISFECKIRSLYLSLDISVDDEGNYVDKKTKKVFKWFSIGYLCGERG